MCLTVSGAFLLGIVMASTYTNIGFEKQGTGENANSWGDITNTNFDMIDEAIAGIYAISSSATSQTITAPSDGTANQSTRFATYQYSGSPSGAVTVTLPGSVKKVINVINGYSQNITFQVGTNATTATVYANSSGIIHTDGVNSVHSLSEGAANQLRYNGTTKAEAVSGGVDGTGILNVSSNIVGSGTLAAGNTTITGTTDITGDLDVDNININGNAITSTDTNGDITITPNGTGSVVLDGNNFPQGQGSSNQVLITNGSGQLSWGSASSALGNNLSLSGGSGWSISVDGSNNLVFTYGSSTVAKIATNGAITSENDIILDGIISTNQDISFDIIYHFKKEIPKCHLTLIIKNSTGEVVLFIDRTDFYKKYFSAKASKYVASIKIQNPLLKPGVYFATFGLSNEYANINDHKFDVIKFQIENIDSVRSSRQGSLFLPTEWEMKTI